MARNKPDCIREGEVPPEQQQSPGAEAAKEATSPPLRKAIDQKQYGEDAGEAPLQRSFAAPERPPFKPLLPRCTPLLSF